MLADLSLAQRIRPVAAAARNFSKSSGGAVAGRLVFGGWRRTGFDHGVVAITNGAAVKTRALRRGMRAHDGMRDRRRS